MKCALRVREGLGMQVSVALPAIGRLIRRDIRMTVRDTLGHCQGAQETRSQGTKGAELYSRGRRRGPSFQAPSRIHGVPAERRPNMACHRRRRIRCASMRFSVQVVDVLVRLTCRHGIGPSERGALGSSSFPKLRSNNGKGRLTGLIVSARVDPTVLADGAGHMSAAGRLPEPTCRCAFPSG